MKTLQIRNVPDDLHKRLKVRAAQAGISLSELALTELRRSAAQPTLQELLDRIAALPPVTLDPPAADAIRHERDSR